MFGVCLQSMDPTGFATAQSGMCFLCLHCSGSRLLCKGTVQVGHVFVHFLHLSCSGSQLFCKGTDPDGLCVLCPSQVLAAQVTGFLMSALFQMDCMSYSYPWSWLLSFLVCHKSTAPGVLCVSCWELISDCDIPGGC